MYATLTDLAAFLGVDEIDLPSTAQRDLDNAEDIIKAYTLGRIDTTTQADVARRATLAQYEFNTAMNGMDMVGTPDSFSAGSFSMQGGMSELAPRARRILLTEGLLYRGVSAR